MDRVIRFVVEQAQCEPEVERVVLFGSRARGDGNERSDYDFAVIAEGLSFRQWSEWATRVREDAPTLCGVDLICLDAEVDPKLVDEIEREGVTIYERP